MKQQQPLWSDARRWWIGRGLGLVLVVGTLLMSACGAPPSDAGAPIVLQGSGNQDSPLIATDDSVYIVQWHATNLVPDVEMPDLPCGFEIIYYKAGGGGAENGGGEFAAITLRTDDPNGPGPKDVSGQIRFRPHPGQGYLSVNVCDRAQYSVTMQQAP